MANQIAIMAERLSIDPSELQNIVVNTVMPSGKQISNEQFVSFLAIANEFGLNPLVKEIYAFAAKGGGIQAVVGIDGWIRIAQNNPDWNGMKHQYVRENGKLISCTCQIFRKSMDHPIEATEYLDECIRPTDTWKNWPSRMLKHKATIQAIRYAFGISGIVEPDEAERANQVKERDITPKTNDMGAVHDAIEVKAKPKPKAKAQKSTNASQSVFDAYAEAIENAQHPGELQKAFGEGWTLLKTSKGNEKRMETLQALYDEKKAYFEGLEANE